MTAPARGKPILVEVAEILTCGYLRLLAEETEAGAEQSADHREDRLDYLDQDEASCVEPFNSEKRP